MEISLKLYLHLFVIFITIFMGCGKEPHVPDVEIFDIYNKNLMPGFDIGIDDSQKQRDWLIDRVSFFEMKYPNNLDWGCVFIVTGAVPFDSSVYEDFSYYKSFSIDLKGDKGGEYLGVSLEENAFSSRYIAKISSLSTSWRTCSFSLKNFADLNLSKLRVVTKFLLLGNESQTIYFKNIKFNSFELPDSNEYEFPIVSGNIVMNTYSIGCNTSDSLTSWIKDEGEDWVMNFPLDQLWATVFISVTRSVDMSKFKSINLEMKGKLGGETLDIGINDKLGEDPSSASSIRWTLSNKWEKINLPLDFFKSVDLKNIYIPIQFVVYNTIGQTIYFRNISLVF
jgi:hypothetical protein